jgi:hypothetical protein
LTIFSLRDFMTRLSRMSNPVPRDLNLRPLTTLDKVSRANPRESGSKYFSDMYQGIGGFLPKNFGIPKFTGDDADTIGGQLLQGLGNVGIDVLEGLRLAGGIPVAAAATLGTESESAYNKRMRGLADIANNQSRMQQGQLSSALSSPSVLSSQSIVGGPSYQQTPTDPDQDAAIRSQIADAQRITEEDGIFGDITQPGMGIPDFVGGVPAAQAEEAARTAAIEAGKDPEDQMFLGKADAPPPASKQETTSGGKAVKGADNSVKQSTVAALDDVLRQVKPDAKPKDYDDYMKEFADLTGLDVSGQPDNSQALMAFGLALMQNKAGKGFNVGRMLSEVGAAGEKAMPALAAARKEAKTTRIKAAEFAISRKDKDQAAALNKQFYYVVPKGGKGFAANFDKGKLKRFNSQELYNLDSDADFQAGFEIIPVSTYEKIATELNKVPEYGDKYQSSNADISLFEDAPKEFQISVQRVDGNYKGPDMPERGRFNVGEYETYAKRLKDMDDGLNAFSDQIGEAYNVVQSDQTTTLNQVGDAATDLMSALGITSGDDLSPSGRVKRILTVIAADQAPKILGEAGKTISDRDRELVREIAGELTLTTPPAKLKLALQTMYNRVVVKGKRNVNNGIATLNQYAGVESDKRTAKMVNGVLVIQ